MGVIHIQGSLADIREMLGRVKNIILNRNAVGWRILQHDEDWFFFTQRDKVVCPICLKLEGTIHRGDYIPNRFPNYNFIDATHIYPQVHYRCRCELQWLDSAETIRDRLHEEISMVV